MTKELDAANFKAEIIQRDYLREARNIILQDWSDYPSGCPRLPEREHLLAIHTYYQRLILGLTINSRGTLGDQQ